MSSLSHMMSTSTSFHERREANSLKLTPSFFSLLQMCFLGEILFMLPKPAEMKEKVGNLSQILTTFHSIRWMPIEQTQPPVCYL